MQSFWDASCHDDGDVGEPLKAQQQAAFNSSCCVTHEREDYCTPTTDSFVHCERAPPFESTPSSSAPTLSTEIDRLSSSSAMQTDGPVRF